MWQGEFGEAYTKRNRVDWRTRVDGFAAMLGGVPVGSALEVGCNRGHNLVALRSLGWQAKGVEPQPYARGLAQRGMLDVQPGSVYEIPFGDASFDLVFTSGVLIHVPPGRLHEAMRELARVSRRYLLAVEYHSPVDERIVYRGHDDLLWKRDYGAHYLAAVPGLEVVRSGVAPSGFEQVDTWWLLEKAVI